MLNLRSQPKRNIYRVRELIGLDSHHEDDVTNLNARAVVREVPKVALLVETSRGFGREFSRTERDVYTRPARMAGLSILPLTAFTAAPYCSRALFPARLRAPRQRSHLVCSARLHASHYPAPLGVVCGPNAIGVRLCGHEAAVAELPGGW